MKCQNKRLNSNSNASEKYSEENIKVLDLLSDNKKEKNILISMLTTRDTRTLNYFLNKGQFSISFNLQFWMVFVKGKVE